MNYAIKLLAYPSSKEKHFWIKALTGAIDRIDCGANRKTTHAWVKKWLYEERDPLSQYFSLVEDKEYCEPEVSFSEIEKNLDNFYDMVSVAIENKCNKAKPHKVDEQIIGYFNLKCDSTSLVIGKLS